MSFVCSHSVGPRRLLILLTSRHSHVFSAFDWFFAFADSFRNKWISKLLICNASWKFLVSECFPVTVELFNHFHIYEREKKPPQTLYLFILVPFCIKLHNIFEVGAMYTFTSLQMPLHLHSTTKAIYSIIPRNCQTHKKSSSNETRIKSQPLAKAVFEPVAVIVSLHRENGVQQQRQPNV